MRHFIISLQENKISSFVFEGITQNLWKFVSCKGYIFYVWHSIVHCLRHTFCQISCLDVGKVDAKPTNINDK